MMLKDLKGTYDAIYSLGLNCMPSMQLQRLHLRNSAGVLDWMISDELSDVTKLFKNRFQNFFDYDDLEVVPYNVPNPQSLYVKDKQYNIISAHDFPINLNTSLANLVSYPEVKEKYNRRIQHFFEKAETSHNMLFVRAGGTAAEAIELDSVLKGMIKHEYKILLLHPSSVTKMNHNSWAATHPTICSLQMPGEQLFLGAKSYSLWDYLMNDIKLNY